MTSTAVAAPTTVINSCEELTELLANHEKVVVDFYAPWVAASKQTAPLFEQLAHTYAEKGVVFAKVDVDENEDCAEEFGVTTVPAFLFFCNAQKNCEVAGAHAEQLTQTAETFVNGGAKPLQPNPSQSLDSATG